MYKIVASENNLVEMLTPLLSKYSKTVVITDENIYRLHGSNICPNIDSIFLPSGEEHKTLSAAEHCWKRMLELRLDRKSCIIAFGGGNITDIAGFVAACYMRGIDIIYIPTTLLGMVDAAIGGKTGINLLQTKNAIGVIRQPNAVIICASLLKTLPDREFRSGIAEIIKYGVISDPLFFDYLINNMPKVLERDIQVLEKIITHSCKIKSEIVERDPNEDTSRWILNWGHTFAHAIESATHYKEYLHGEAVSIGMCCAAKLSRRLGFADSSLVEKQKYICHLAGLPTSLPPIPGITLLTLMRRDKKAVSQKISLILAEEIGKVFKHENIEECEILEILNGNE